MASLPSFSSSSLIYYSFFPSPAASICSLVINGVRFEWGPGDIIVTPFWASVDHEASERADLFAISDRPVLHVLHL